MNFSPHPLLLLLLFLHSSNADSEWLELSPSGKGISERKAHASDYLVRDMALVVFGGENSNGYLNDTRLFSFTTLQWSQITTPGPSARAFSPFIRLGDTKLALFGGVIAGRTLGDLWAFSLPSGWTVASITGNSGPAARFGHASVLADTSYIFGGASLPSQGTAADIVFRNDLWILDEISDGIFSWTLVVPLAESPPARAGHSMALMLTDSLVVFGGTSGASALGDVWVYDISDNFWTSLESPSPPAARSFHSVCSLGLNMIIHGGETDVSGVFNSETWLFDSNFNWVQLSDIVAPQATAQHTLTRISSSACVSFGGIGTSSTINAALREITSHPTDAKWTKIYPSDTSPMLRQDFSAVVVDTPSDVVTALADEQPASTAQYSIPFLWVFGGAMKNGTLLGDVWKFNFYQNIWEQVFPSAGISPGPFRGAKSVTFRHFAVFCGGSLTTPFLWGFNLRTLKWLRITPLSGSSLLLRTLHQASLATTSNGSPVLIVDGGLDSNGQLLADVVSVPLSPLSGVASAGTTVAKMYYFNGQSNYVMLWYPSSVRHTFSASTVLTFDLIFKSTSNVIDGATLLSWAAVSGGNPMRIFLKYSTGTMCVGPGEYTPSNPVSCGDIRVDDDRFHHILVSVGSDPNSFSMYIDGKLDSFDDPAVVKIKADFSIGVSTLIVGAAFPPSLPYLVTEISDSGKYVYRRVNSPPYWTGYVESVRVWEGLMTPQSLNYFPDNSTFPTSKIVNKTACLGSWDFDTISNNFDTPDSGGSTSVSAHPAAYLGSQNLVLATVPRLATLNFPNQIESLPTWRVADIVTLLPDDENVTAPARSNHASAVLQHTLYTYGGVNSTNVLDGIWSFNLLTGEWKPAFDTSKNNGSMNSILLPFQNSNGPALLTFGGVGVPGDALANVSLTQIPLAARVFSFSEDVQDVNVPHGLGLRVELSGHFAALLPNSSMMIVFGGSMRNNELEETTTDAENYVLSNRLLAMDLSTPRTYVLSSVLAVGIQPPERLAMPFALSPQGEMVAFTGSFTSPLWSFQVDNTAWKQISTIDKTGSSGNGFVFLDNLDGTMSYLGYRCEKFFWAEIETNEACKVTSMSYNLNSANVWSVTNQNYLIPSFDFNPAGKDVAAVILAYPQFCAYDGTSGTCGETFPDPTYFSAESLDDTDFTYCVSLNKLVLLAWVSNHKDIVYLFYDGLYSVFVTPSTTISLTGVTAGLTAAYIPSLKSHFLFFSSTSTVRGSGTDSDIMFIRSPTPQRSAICSESDTTTAVSVTASYFNLKYPPISMFAKSGIIQYYSSAGGGNDEIFATIGKKPDGTYEACITVNPYSATVYSAAVSAGAIDGLVVGFDIIGSLPVIVWVEALKEAPEQVSNSDLPFVSMVTTASSETTESSDDGTTAAGSGGEASGETTAADASLRYDHRRESASEGSAAASLREALTSDRDIFLQIFDYETALAAQLAETQTYIFRDGGGRQNIANAVMGNLVVTWNTSSASELCQFSVKSSDPTVLKYEIVIATGAGFMNGVGGAFGLYDGAEPGSYPYLASSTTQQPGCPASDCRYFSTGPSFSLSVIRSSFLTARQDFRAVFRAIRVVAVSPNYLSDISDEKDPAVGVRNTSVVVAWSSNAVDVTGQSTADYNIWFSLSSNSGRTLTTAALLDSAGASDSSTDDTAPRVVWSGAQSVMIIWLSRKTVGGVVSNYSIKAASSSNSGVSWTVQTIASDVVPYSSPSLAFNGAAWVAVWQVKNKFGSDYDIVFSRSDTTLPSSSSAWSAPNVLYPLALRDIGDDVSPTIDTSGSVFIVGWMSTENFDGMFGSDSDPMIVESKDNGKTWTEPLSPYSTSSDPAVVNSISSFTVFGYFSPTRVAAFTKGNVVSLLAWTMPDAGVNALCSAVDDWSSPYLLDDSYSIADSGTDENPSITISPGISQAIVAWQSTNNIGAGSLFPVPALFARYRMFSYETTQAQPPNSVGTITVRDTQGSAHLAAADEGISIVPATSPTLYDSLAMNLDYNFPSAKTPNVLKSGLITNFPTRALSVSLWLKAAFPDGVGALFSWTARAEQDFDFYARLNLALVDCGATDTFRSSLSQESDAPLLLLDPILDQAVRNTLSDGTWHHYVFAFDVYSTVVRFYIDLVMYENNMGLSQQTLGSTGYLWIGGQPIDSPEMAWESAASSLQVDPSQIFSGQICDFMIFGSVVTAAGAQSLYDLDVLSPSANIRFTSAALDTLNWEASAWANPQASGSSTSPLIVASTVPSHPASKVLMMFNTTDPNTGSSGATDSDVGVSFYDHVGKNWTRPVPLVSAMQSDSGADQTPVVFQCGISLVAIWSSRGNFYSKTGTDYDLWYSAVDDSGQFSSPSILNLNAPIDSVDDVDPTVTFDGLVATVVWKVSGSSSTSDVLWMSRSDPLNLCHGWSAPFLVTDGTDTEVVRRNLPVLYDTGTFLMLYYSSDTRVFTSPTRDLEITLVQTPANPSFACFPAAVTLKQVIPTTGDPRWVRDAVVSSVGTTDIWVVPYSFQKLAKMSPNTGGGGISVIAGLLGQMKEVLVAGGSPYVDYLSPAVACSDGGVCVVVWAESSDVASYLKQLRLKAAVSTDSGASFGAAVSLYAAASTSAAGARIQPSVACNQNGVFVVVWHATDSNLLTGDDTDIVWIEYTHSTMSWSKPQLLFWQARTDSGKDENPTIMYERSLQTWLLVWESGNDFGGKGVDLDIVMSRRPFTNYDALCNSAVAGASRSTLNLQNSDAYDGLTVASSPYDKSVLIAWSGVLDTGKYSTDDDIYFAYSLNSGATFANGVQAVQKSVEDSFSDFAPSVIFVGGGGGGSSEPTTYLLAWHTSPQLTSGVSMLYGINVARVTLNSSSCFVDETQVLLTNHTELLRSLKTKATSVLLATTRTSLDLYSDGKGFVQVSWLGSYFSQTPPNDPISSSKIWTMVSSDYGRNWTVLDPGFIGFGTFDAPKITYLSPGNLFMVLGCNSALTTDNSDMDVFGIYKGDFYLINWNHFATDTGTDSNPSIAIFNSTVIIVIQSSDPFVELAKYKSTGGLGTDFDIMYSVSIDTGMTWSAFAPLHASAATDTFDDIKPTIAVNSDGIFAVTWLSAENFGSLAGYDVDPVVSESRDGGKTWSEPRLLNSDFDSDTEDETYLKVYCPPNSKTFVASWARNTMGSPSAYVVSWSSSLQATSCATNNSWSLPGAVGAYASLDGGSIDKNSRIASNQNGDVVAVWSSNTPTLNTVIYPSELSFWWTLASLPIVDVSGTTATSASHNGTLTFSQTSHFSSGSVLTMAGTTSVSMPVESFPRAFTISFWAKFSTKNNNVLQTVFAKTQSKTSNLTDIEWRASKDQTILNIGVEKDIVIRDSYLTDMMGDDYWHHYSLTVNKGGKAIHLSTDGISRYSRVGKSVQPFSSIGTIYFGNAPCQKNCTNSRACCPSNLSSKSDGYRGSGMFADVSHFQMWKAALVYEDLRKLLMPNRVLTKFTINYGTDFDFFTSKLLSDWRWGTVYPVNPETATTNNNYLDPVLQTKSAVSTIGRRCVVVTDYEMAPDFERDFVAVELDTVSWPFAKFNYYAPMENYNGDSRYERSLSVVNNNKTFMGIFTSGMGADSKIRFLNFTENIEPAPSCTSPQFAVPTTIVRSVATKSMNYTAFQNLQFLPLGKEGVFGFFVGVSSGVMSEIFSIVSTNRQQWQTSLLPIIGDVTSPFRGTWVPQVASAINDDGYVLVAVVTVRVSLYFISTLNGSTQTGSLVMGSHLTDFQSSISSPVTSLMVTKAKFSTFYLAWVEESSAGSVARFATCSPDCTVQGTAFQITAAGISPSISYDDADTYVIIFQSSDPSGFTGRDSDIYYSKNTHGSTTWTAPAPVNTNAGYDVLAADVKPQIYCSDAYWIAVWTSNSTLREFIGADRDILVSVRRFDIPGQDAWSDPLPVNMDAMEDVYDDYDPSITCEEQVCVVTWTRQGAFDSDIMFATTSDLVSWTAPTYLSVTMAVDTAEDVGSFVFTNYGNWIVAFTMGTNISVSLYSGDRFFTGALSNYLTTSSGIAPLQTSLKVQDFGTKISVRVSGQERLLAYYVVKALLYLVLPDSEGYAVSFAIPNVTPKHQLLFAFGVPYVHFEDRFDFAAATVPFNNRITGTNENLLIIQGGKNVNGYVSSLVMHNPASGRWEQLKCSSSPLPKMNGHDAVAYRETLQSVILFYGNPVETRSTDTAGSVYRVSDLTHVENSKLFMRATCNCNKLVTTGTPPTWNRYQQAVILRSYLFILNSALNADSSNIASLELGSLIWSTVPSVRNPPRTSLLFNAFMSNAQLYVLSAVTTTVSMKSTNFDRINAAKCTAASPTGNYLAAAATGERAVIDVTARTSLGLLVESGSDLSVELVSSTTGTRIRGKYDSSPTTGVFRFVYSATSPGKYELRILAFGVNIGNGNPYSVEVTPGATSLEQSSISLQQLTNAQANSLTTFSILAKDAFGNAVLGGDDVSIEVVQDENSVVAKVVDNYNGVYSVSFSVTKAGNYTVYSTLNGEQMSGSPYLLVINPGNPQGDLSNLTGTDVALTKAGKGGTFSVRAVDSTGNALTQSLGDGAVKIDFFDLNQPLTRASYAQVDPNDIPTFVKDNGDGSYDIQYFPFVDGNFIYTIKVNGTTVKGSPFSLKIDPVFVKPDSSGPMRYLALSLAGMVALGAFVNVHMIARIYAFLFRKKDQTLSQAEQDFVKKFESRNLSAPPPVKPIEMSVIQTTRATAQVLPNRRVSPPSIPSTSSQPLPNKPLITLPVPNGIDARPQLSVIHSESGETSGRISPRAPVKRVPSNLIPQPSAVRPLQPRPAPPNQLQ